MEKWREMDGEMERNGWRMEGKNLPYVIYIYIKIEDTKDPIIRARILHAHLRP
jgi:hypothetical protein